MSKPNSVRRRVAACLAAGCAGLALASTASAVDLRDWGRKFPASQRFVLLSQFNNEAVLDKETQLVWQRYISNADTFQTGASNACASARIGGRMGWRLPTIAELTSLVDPGSSAAVKLPAGHPFRQADGSQIPAYAVLWSSTFDRLSPQDPALLNSYRYYWLPVGTAAPQIEGAANERQFICVRGPDSGNAY